MTTRPGWKNKEDACASCAKMLPTPTDHENPGTGELYVWQPNQSDPPQWLCKKCLEAAQAEQRRY